MLYAGAKQIDGAKERSENRTRVEQSIMTIVLIVSQNQTCGANAFNSKKISKKEKCDTKRKQNPVRAYDRS